MALSVETGATVAAVVAAPMQRMGCVALWREPAGFAEEAERRGKPSSGYGFPLLHGKDRLLLAGLRSASQVAGPGGQRTKSRISFRY